MNCNSFSLDELEFFVTQQYQVKIIPNFDQQELNLIIPVPGNFRSNTEISVPLWLALMLRQKGKCKLLPSWLSQRELSLMLEREVQQPNQLAPLPDPHFIELSYIVLNNAPEDVPDCKKVRFLLEDIENHRKAKLNKKLFNIRGPVMFKNATQFEVNKYRHPLGKAMEGYQNLVPPEGRSGEGEV